MEFIKHDRFTDLNLVTKNLKDILSIKLSRVRERHASAMGFNSYNHLIDEIRKKGEISVSLVDYFLRLEGQLITHHQIALTQTMRSSIIEIAHQITSQQTGIPMYYYLGWLPDQDLTSNDEEGVPPLQEPLVKMDEIEQHYICHDGEFYCDIKSKNNPQALHFFDTVVHGIDLNYGITIILSPTKMPENFFTEQGQIFHYLCTETLIADEDDFDGDVEFPSNLKDLDDTWYYAEFIEVVLNMNDQIANLLKQHNPKLQLNISNNESWEPALDLYPDEDDIDAIDLHCLCYPSLNIDSNETALIMAPFSSVLAHKFDSEFIEAYTKIPELVASNPIFKAIGKTTFNLKSVHTDNRLFKISDFLWVEALRGHDDLPLDAGEDDYEDFVGQEIDLINTFLNYKINKIECYALIGHETGDEIIMGCIGLDEMGFEQIRFQIDLFSCSDFFHEWVPKLRNDHKIEVSIQNDFEYDFSRVWVETEWDLFATFMFPQYSAPSYSLGFLVIKTEQRALPNKCVDLKQHPELLSMGIQNSDERKVTILPPMHFPLLTDSWHSSVKQVIDLHYGEGIKSNEKIAAAIRAEMEPRCTNNTSLVCSPILFHYPSSRFKSVLWNCNVLYGKGKNSHSFGATPSAIKPLEDALGLSPIQSFLFNTFSQPYDPNREESYNKVIKAFSR